MHCSIIVLTWNGEKYLEACLQAVLAQDYPDFDVIVVDNASTDSSVSIIEAFAPRVQLIRNETNLGFAGGNNVGLRVVQGEIVVLLNQDTVVQPGWLMAIVETFADPTIGIVGCKALYPDGKTIQHAGAKVNPIDAFTTHIGQGEIDTGQYEQLTEADYVTGAAFAMRRALIEKIGGLDEGFNPALYEEVDYCYRARRVGVRVVYQPKAILIHHESTSLSASIYQRNTLWHCNRIRFKLRHALASDLLNFERAEWQAINEGGMLADVLARGQAYLENILSWHHLWQERQTASDLGGVLPDKWQSGGRQMLVRLWHQARQVAFTFLVDDRLFWEQPLPKRPVPPAFVQPDTSLSEFLNEAVGFWEPLINSKIPFIGIGIDRVRNFILNTWVRPYLVPILQRQAEFNARQVGFNAQIEYRLALGQHQLDTLRHEQHFNLLETQESLKRRLIAANAILDALQQEQERLLNLLLLNE